MERAVIISSNSDISQKIESAAVSEGFLCSAFSSCNSARRILSNGSEPALIIINTPLPDEFGQEFAEMAAENTAAAIILICSGDISDDVADRVSDHGIYVLPRPLNRELFLRTVRLVTSSRSRMIGMKKENSEILTRIGEMRLINRAKAILMKYLKFTEPQAHSYITRQSMNNRQTRRETAEKILSQYEK